MRKDMVGFLFACYRGKKNQIPTLFDTKKDRLSFGQTIMDIFNLNIDLLYGLLMFRFL